MEDNRDLVMTNKSEVITMADSKNTNLNRCKDYRLIKRLRSYSEASNLSNAIYYTLTFYMIGSENNI